MSQLERLSRRDDELDGRDRVDGARRAESDAGGEGDPLKVPMGDARAALETPPPPPSPEMLKAVGAMKPVRTRSRFSRAAMSAARSILRP